GIPLRGPDNLPINKPPYNRLTAIDFDTGEHLWWIPVGDTPNNVKNHPALQGVDIGDTGGGSRAISMVMGDIVVITEETADGGQTLTAIDKATGNKLAKIPSHRRAQYGMMTYMHEGKQYLVTQVGGDGEPGGLVAYALPD